MRGGLKNATRKLGSNRGAGFSDVTGMVVVTDLFCVSGLNNKARTYSGGATMKRVARSRILKTLW